MLKVIVKKENNKFKKINLLGHTEYDDYGRDIVCSSASSIMITTINAIMMFDKNYITYEEKKDNFIIVKKENISIIINNNDFEKTIDLPDYLKDKKVYDLFNEVYVNLESKLTLNPYKYLIIKN